MVAFLETVFISIAALCFGLILLVFLVRVVAWCLIVPTAYILVKAHERKMKKLSEL